MSPHLSTLTLHRLRLGELAPAEEGQARTHLAGCPVCEGRLGHQEQTRAAFVATPMPRVLADAAAPSLWDRFRATFFAPLLVPLALAVAALAVLPVADPVADSAVDTVREKGGLPRIEAWLQTEQGSRLLDPGETLRAGAHIQLKFNPGKHRFVTLAGRDGTGAVEVYGTVPVTDAGLQPAPFALTLDDSPGEQAFYAVLTDARPDADALLGTLRSDPRTVPNGEIARVTFHKE